MDAAVADHVAYWELRLAACGRRPGLHRRQLAALEALAQVARDASDQDDLIRRLAERGLTDAEVAAGMLDRYHGLGRLFERLGDDARADAVAALEPLAGPPIAPLAAVLHGQVAVERRLQELAIARAGFARAARLVCDWRTEPDLGTCEAQRLMLALTWRDARRLDPGLDAARLARPYRDRLPWTDAGVARVAGWLAEADADPGLGLELPPVPPPVPLPAAELAALEAAADAAWAGAAPTEAAPDPARARLAELTAAAPTAIAARLAAAREGLPVRLAGAAARATADRLRGRAAAQVQPHVAALAAALDADLARAATETEATLAATWFDERLAIEADAGELLVAVAVRPLDVMLTEAGAEPAAARRAIAAATALLGAPWPDVLATPYLAELLARVAVGGGGALEAPCPTGELGEVGVAIAGAIRAAITDPASPAARALAGHRPLTVAAVGGVCRAIAAGAGPADPPPAGPALRVAGAACDAAGLADALAAPREGLPFLAPGVVLG
jgi:hypothetical protein